MNAQNAKDFLPLVQALADGKTIQVIFGTAWVERKDFDFTRDASHYRIKPPPREWILTRWEKVSDIASIQGPTLIPFEEVKVREI